MEQLLGNLNYVMLLVNPQAKDRQLQMSGRQWRWFVTDHQTHQMFHVSKTVLDNPNMAMVDNCIDEFYRHHWNLCA